MSKLPHSEEFKLNVVKEYSSGEGSYKELIEKYGIGVSTFQAWLRKYREHGENSFTTKIGNTSYSKEFKTMCVEVDRLH